MLESHKYERLTDAEWIRHLTSTPIEEQYHRYFFEVKCAPFLRYIAQTLFNTDDTTHILGEFYEFISKNEWHILKQFKGYNSASLNSYLSRCTVRHFIEYRRKETTSKNMMHSIEQTDIIEELNHFTSEEEQDMPPVWQAFEQLNERDRTVLRCMVIEGLSSLEAAEQIWPYVKSEHQDWKRLPVKRVQDTIAMLKRRAILSLTTALKKL